MLKGQFNFTGGKFRGEVGAGYFCAIDAGAFKTRLAKIDTAEIRLAKITVAEVQAFGIEPSQIETPQVAPLQVGLFPRRFSRIEFGNAAFSQQPIHRIVGNSQLRASGIGGVHGNLRLVWVVLFIWFLWFIWFNQRNKTN
jgi:hypothetical protein